jgi:N-acetylglucosaminyl-diphospho-decaprenol L-rhamnosyltransferase
VDLSIVIVNWNTRELLRECLASAYGTIEELEYEVLVVDNNSNDGSAEAVATEFPQVRLIRNHDNVGFARANNQAIRVSRGRHVLLLNSDARLLPGTANAMVELLDRKPGVAIVGVQVLNPDGSFQASYSDFPSLVGELLLATKLARPLRGAAYPNYPLEQSQHERSTDWISGACLMARRAAVNEVGLLDESYFMYTEETDWCYRMRQAGWTVYYLAGSRVIHWGSQSSRRVPEPRRSLVYRSKWLFMRKHRGAAVAEVFRAALWAISALKLGLWAARSLHLDGTQRALARQHMRSYTLVLRALRGAPAA